MKAIAEHRANSAPAKPGVSHPSAAHLARRQLFLGQAAPIAPAGSAVGSVSCSDRAQTSAGLEGSAVGATPSTCPADALPPLQL